MINEFRIFLYHRLFQIKLHLHHHFELVYLIVKLHVATFDETENASMGTYFVSL